MYRHLTIIAALLLLFCVPARAQGPAVEETRAVTYDIFTNDIWGLTVFLPEGGTYYDPEDLGISSEDDPMNYPLIWIIEDIERPFNMMMFGALDVDGAITEEDYGYYFDQFFTNVQADFPYLMYEVDGVEVLDRVWDRFVVADDDGATMINYLTYVGNTYYSTSFLVGNIADLDSSLDATVEQLWITYLEDDLIPEEDILLPWYF
ncbi:MAG: hypothetical protein R3F46_04235 [bacterium]